MRATQKTIAKSLGIDRTTVSKALSNSPTVSAELKQRVRQLCDEVGYRPHASALSLKSERTRIVSLVGAYTGVEGVQALWVMRLHDAAQRRGYRCRIDTHEDAATVVSEASADGFVVFGQHELNGLPPGTWLPAVFTDCGEQGDLANSVTSGNSRAAAEVVAHLHGLGHTKIAYLGLVPGHEVSVDRHQGFLREMRRRDLEVPDGFVVLQGDWPVEVEDSLRHEARLMRAVAAGATAIIATKDIAGVAVLRMLGRNGLSVPRDVSVVTWDDTLVTRATSPQLTTVRQNLGPAADCAIDMLIRLMEQEGRRLPGVVIPSTLVVRGSTAPRIASIS